MTRHSHLPNARFLVAVFVAFASVPSLGVDPEKESEAPWQSWLENFGHDSYRYPAWISSQRQRCSCDIAGGDMIMERRIVKCHDGGMIVEWHSATELTWCVALHFSLSHMPEFDLDFLPGSVSVEGVSMLDDNIAFALMAWNASKLSPKVPLDVALPYLLPYADYHEARANWRPLFFAKYFNATSSATNSRAVLTALIGGGTPLMSWAKYTWPGFPSRHNSYELQPFASGTAPPVIAPFDFAAYGYGSCTAWSTFLTSTLRAVGVPARQVGTPCWNTDEFAGLAIHNPNVSFCWSGGRPSGPSGGMYLNNHNWVEYWDNQLGDWQFVDVASSSLSEDTWFCSNFSGSEGCGCSSKAGKAGQDHDIFAPTWSAVDTSTVQADGGPVVDVANLRLSSGEAVSPLVWSPKLASPRGRPLRNIGLRLVNRTSFYRCRQQLPSQFFA